MPFVMGISMSDVETRYAALLARCSNSAKRHLTVLPRHPLLPEIVETLEGKQGTLQDRDIEDCFLAVIMKHARLDDRGL
jgi:hypothetical protein